MFHPYYFTITSKLHLKTLSTLFKRSFVKILRRKKKQKKQLQTTPQYRETLEQNTHSVHSFPGESWEPLTFICTIPLCIVELHQDGLDYLHKRTKVGLHETREKTPEPEVHETWLECSR